jgi:hypothetical protein
MTDPAVIRKAIFDPDAFYPFRSLVNGALTDITDLPLIEEFLRAILLHDEMLMEIPPFAAQEEEEAEWSEEEIEAGGRVVITAIGPTIHEYGLFTDRTGPSNTPQMELSETLRQLAEVYSEATDGNVYHEAHLEFLKRVMSTVQSGGSVICRSPFLQDAVQTAAAFPGKLFEPLDKDWQELGKRLGGEGFGPLVPPVLGIVLTRSASREKIPVIVRDLRDEWADARSKVWNLTDALKTARTLAEATEIERELTAASKYFSPISRENSSRPVQVLWELVMGGVGGAVTGVLSGGNPKIGAAAGAIGQTIKIVQKDSDLGRILFGRGAFDLAKRVRNEVSRVDRDRLRTFLSESERRALGLED